MTADEWLALPRLNPWWPFLSDRLAVETVDLITAMQRRMWAAVMVAHGR